MITNEEVKLEIILSGKQSWDMMVGYSIVTASKATGQIIHNHSHNHNKFYFVPQFGSILVVSLFFSLSQSILSSKEAVSSLGQVSQDKQYNDTIYIFWQIMPSSGVFV
jgi:hypothetical protein